MVFKKRKICDRMKKRKNKGRGGSMANQKNNKSNQNKSKSQSKNKSTSSKNSTSTKQKNASAKKTNASKKVSKVPSTETKPIKTNAGKKIKTTTSIKNPQPPKEKKVIKETDFEKLGLSNKKFEEEIEEDIKKRSKELEELSEILLSRTIFEEENTKEVEIPLSEEIFQNLEDVFEEEPVENQKQQQTEEKESSLKKGHSKGYKSILIDCFLLLFCIILFLVLISITPKIHLLGDTTMKLDYGTTYVEPGATAKYLGKDYTKNLEVTGKVSTDKIGVYYVTYKIKNSSFQLTKKRKIEVVDRKPPVIKLVGDEEVKICPDSTYSEEGIEAIDEYEGDLTKQVKIKKEKDYITYSVKDSSNNEAKVIRKIVEIDQENPRIELEGSETVYADFEGTYKEPGYKVTDNCDGDITNQVEVQGSVDTSKMGRYQLTYAVKDKSGNTSEVTRTVVVSRRTDPESGTLKSGAIYLTFDDGPNPGTTSQILDILKEEGVKATFFVTAHGPDSLLKREFDEGHSIALHTATHDYSYVYRSEENYFEDLKRVSDRVKRVTGQETKLIRFPGGSSNTVSRHYNQGIMTRLTAEVLERGYRYYDWNVDASDAWQCAKSSVSNKRDCVYNNVTRNLSKSNANVVLMHDVKQHTADALRDIIRYGKENGYSFELIDMGTKMVRFKVNN